MYVRINQIFEHKIMNIYIYILIHQYELSQNNVFLTGVYTHEVIRAWVHA